MKFSLIVGTVGRSRELAVLLDSLARQTYTAFEVIVVDQNPDDTAADVIRDHGGALSIRHLRCAPGLSRARNLGLKSATGDVLAFPDDDCAYPTNLLERVAARLAAHPDWGGLTGRSVSEGGRPSANRWASTAGTVTRFQVWRRAISFSIFLRHRVVDQVGTFDETLGVGAGTPWGSGEETDYLLRAINRGFSIHYDPEITVVHPENIVHPDRKTRAKGMRYGAGMGRVLRKHRFPLWFTCYQWARPLMGSGLALTKGKASWAAFYWAVFRGRVGGWWA